MKRMLAGPGVREDIRQLVCDYALDGKDCAVSYGWCFTHMVRKRTPDPPRPDSYAALFAPTRRALEKVTAPHA